ncbi:MAG: beta-ketoacyl-[acyl-carrier-protein] synthase family protein [Oryzomonas sp.]|uniref:beta-ketoacyl-[acyl-carrier-protein] synthase family protein n=1 Tax=Oryzomonas sp. TaxID=2855186 RepID=UPI00283AF868|nr:beta-ketoacyl-[acyl-carrier-protein] synthase family protein [Oryzomonas sp.]MDR3578806.1 beta-ketoacyl-[acyl-carrier-protein] synthase family protein [Oryzomonas sp.]
MKRRVVITGLGVFCGAGKNVAQFSDALLNGKSGIAPLDLFDVSAFPSRIGCQVKGYDPLDHFDRTMARKLSRADQFGLIAAADALADSGVAGHYSPFDMGISMGGGAAGMFQSEQWLKSLLSGVHAPPVLLRGVLPDKTATEIARACNLAGFQGTVTTACSSSATAIGWGAELVATGQQRAVVAGGSDTLSLLTFCGFNALKVVDPEPCSPFSQGRLGISLGEGAAFLVLESEEDALARGARMYGAVLGYALAGESYHMTAPEPTGATAARVMGNAIAAAGIDSSRVEWVNAHGTGTPLNDVVESHAMKLVFGDRAASVPLVSTKAMTGHCLGAAGAIEALATVIALNHRIIPQTLNFRGRDPECDLDYGHEGKRPGWSGIAMSNSFAFGGNITSLVLGS